MPQVIVTIGAALFMEGTAATIGLFMMEHATLILAAGTLIYGQIGRAHV